MKWIYGKQDWKTFERGQENCYLMTNGLGGFSSMTMTGSAARNDHAFLMACMKAPNNRYNVIHRLAEKIETEGKGYSLSSQEFADGTREEGYRNLSAFSYDACDGRRSTGSAKAGCRICAVIKAGEYREISVVFSVSGAAERLPAPGTAGEIIRGQKEYCRELGDRAGFSSDMAECLAKSASQFIAERESTGGDTILAGFPFFEDWGRDTMIALPGICLSTRRYDEAKSILRTFARYEKEGLMPNLFPEGGKEPMYNTVDAALLFINCVWLYYDATKDLAFVEEMYPVMERILNGYRRGTRFGIHMAQDGLIMAGEGLDQVTWMDVRVGEILPTPRHGKPVEVNAYWYNALRIMAEFSRKRDGDGTGYETLAEKVKESFTETFWMEEKHCLKDVISGTDADMQIRCNQIWAVSMPFTMLDPEREQQVVDTVFEKLYTPYGLRTLSQDDPQFRPSYGGEVLERDLAYHQGTVWVYPLGAYYLARLKVNGDSEETKEEVKAQLEVLESALREGCIGQLPEIYDGENPVSSKGCFAQAWSVGEILRVYERLEKVSE